MSIKWDYTHGVCKNIGVFKKGKKQFHKNIFLLDAFFLLQSYRVNAQVLVGNQENWFLNKPYLYSVHYISKVK